MEPRGNTCPHVLDDRAALLKESLRKESWQLTRTCARCGAALYPTHGTLILMGIVDRLNYLFGMALGLWTKHMLPPALPLLANLLICLAVLLLSSRILEVVTRPILLAGRWQLMDDRVRDNPDILRQWYGKTTFLTLICFVVVAAVCIVIF